MSEQVWANVIALPDGAQLEVTQIEGKVVFRRIDQIGETVEFTKDEWLQIVDSASKIGPLLEGL